MSSPEPKASKQCYRCLKMGHFQADCPAQTLCYTCGQAGHIAAQCTRHHFRPNHFVPVGASPSSSSSTLAEPVSALTSPLGSATALYDPSYGYFPYAYPQYMLPPHHSLFVPGDAYYAPYLASPEQPFHTSSPSTPTPATPNALGPDDLKHPVVVESKPSRPPIYYYPVPFPNSQTGSPEHYRRCFSCGEPGHTNRTCPTVPYVPGNHHFKQPYRCTYCNRQGHLYRFCYERAKDQGGPYGHAPDQATPLAPAGYLAGLSEASETQDVDGK